MRRLILEPDQQHRIVLSQYDELVACLKMDLEALSTRLCEAEESSRSFTKREEALLDQVGRRVQFWLLIESDWALLNSLKAERQRPERSEIAREIENG